MSIMSQEAKKGLGCVLHWSGESAVSGAYDDDGNKRGFLILQDGVTVTPSGTFTTQKMKDGRNIWKFDGSTNVIYIPQPYGETAYAFGSDNFTICCWANFSMDSVYRCMLGSTGANGMHAGITFRFDNTNKLQGSIHVTSNNYGITATSASPANIWLFCTFIRNDGYLYLYINGNEVATPVACTGSVYQCADWYAIGRNGIFANNPTFFGFANGNIKDLMIFQGKALTQDQIAAIMAETYIY